MPTARQIAAITCGTNSNLNIRVDNADGPSGSANVRTADAHPEKRSAPDQNGSELGRAAKPAIFIIVATAVLWLAKEILLPLAVAATLALITSPIANRLQNLVGRLVSALFVVVVSVAAVTIVGYLVSFELASVAVELTAYSNNIARKLSAFQQNTPRWVERIEASVKSIEQQVEESHPGHKGRKTVVTAASASPSLQKMLRPALPVLSGAVEALLVVPLLFFFLYERKALRARFVRLAARARVTIAAEAVDAASDAVSHYLFLYSLVNLVFGVAIGSVTFFFGLPQPWFWGLLAFLLRFIPYVGAFASALLPAAVAFAIFPGWIASLGILGSFLVLDQLLAQFVEPIFIGRGIGVSPVAMLISAMYWAWLWGPVGLILAIPATLCLKAAGDYIPPLSFFSVLLAADNADESYLDFYRRLLERDQPGARELALRHCGEYGLESTFDDFLTPVAILSGEEAADGHLSREDEEFIIDSVRALIADLGSGPDRKRPMRAVRVLGACAPHELHSLGLLMLLEVLRRDGAVVEFISGDRAPQKVEDSVDNLAVELVCLSCTLKENVGGAVELIAALRAKHPSLMIVAGGRAAMANAAGFLDAGCVQVCRDRAQVLRLLQRARLSTPAGSASRSSRFPVQRR